jgi:hypothetical protein
VAVGGSGLFARLAGPKWPAKDLNECPHAQHPSPEQRQGSGDSTLVTAHHHHLAHLDFLRAPRDGRAVLFLSGLPGYSRDAADKGRRTCPLDEGKPVGRRGQRGRRSRHAGKGMRDEGCGMRDEGCGMAHPGWGPHDAGSLLEQPRAELGRCRPRERKASGFGACETSERASLSLSFPIPKQSHPTFSPARLTPSLLDPPQTSILHRPSSIMNRIPPHAPPLGTCSSPCTQRPPPTRSLPAAALSGPTTLLLASLHLFPISDPSHPLLNPPFSPVTSPTHHQTTAGWPDASPMGHGS